MNSILNRAKIHCFRIFIAYKSTGPRPTAKVKTEQEPQEKPPKPIPPPEYSILGETYATDQWTNVTPHIISLTGRKLHQTPQHPLTFIKLRIRDYFYANYKRRSGNPLYSLYEDFSPVVTAQENFDSLLVPSDHVSRLPSDTYYINSTYLLR